MRLTSLALFATSFIFSQLSFAAACPASSTATASGSADGTNCTVTGTASTIQLNFITGFTDATAVSAVGGNNGTTVGAQRKLSFIKAAEILADQVQSSQTVIMDATFTLLSCTAGSATLGSAGATVSTYHPAPPAGITANTWYPIGLYNDISNADNLSAATDAANGYSGNGTGSDINAKFNSNIGQAGCLSASNGWYYGFDSPPANYIGFTTVLLHEATHGFGFASLTSASTGAKSGGLDDVFSNGLYDQTNGAWSGLSNAQRAANAISGTALLWNGTNVNTQAVGLLTAGYHDADSSSSFTSGDRVQMYAPNPVEGGSSVSHFNTTASPNELMEPQYTEGQMDLGLALYLLKDIGWGISVAANTAPTITAVNQSTNEDVALTGVDASGWGSDADADSLTYSITTCPANVSCSINSDGTNLSLTPAANYNGATNTVTIQVDDGTDTASDTFNLNVIAQNDDPSISGIPDQTIKSGESTDILLTTYASDIDGDGLTYSDTACGANLTCSFPSANTIRVAASGGVGTTVSVTVEADDSNGGTNTDTFDVTITSAVPSTTVALSGTTHNDGDTFTLPLSGGQIDVNDGTGNYSYALDFNGNDVSALVTSNASGLTIGMPSSGEFAGDYTLTITDNGDGDVITLTVKRPLRLVWSTTSILNGDTSHTLKVEGGAAGTTYTPVQAGDNSLIMRDGNGAAIASVDASNDADSFNAGVFNLDTHTVVAMTTTDVTIQSTYDDVSETGIRVYPAVEHSFTVVDTTGNAIANAAAGLDGGEALLADLKLALSFTADANGEFTLSLPDTSDTFAMTVSASGFNSQALTLDNVTTTHSVTLTEMANAITLSGSISALGSQDFLQHSPAITLTFADGTTESLVISVTTVSQASFSHQVDLNLKDLDRMQISQEDSLTIDMDISNVTQSQTYNILMERHVAVVASRPTPNEPTDIGGGGSGGGSLGWFALIALSLLSIRKARRVNA